MSALPCAVKLKYPHAITARVEPPPSPLPAQPYRRDLDRPRPVTHPDRAVLHGHLQRHGALSQRGERLALVGGDLPDAEIPEAGEARLDRFPPDGCARAEAVDADPADARG